MSTSLPVVLPWLSTAACSHSLSKGKEDRNPKFFQKREDTSLPAVSQQAWSAGLLPTPDAVSLAREWDPIVILGPSYMPHLSCRKWNRLPSPAPTKWAACRGMDTSGKRRALKGKGDHVSCSGRTEEGVYTNSYTWLYTGNSGTKLLEFECWPFHFLAIWPWASHLSSLVK